ncbi:pyruvate dehydrogenase (acetyl-transferring) kinase, mitochondrial [Tanacetum coccineum]
MLRAFLMSLTGPASRWLRNEPTGSITTWDGHKTKFLNKYCPPARTAKKKEEINNFQQEPDENLYQAWERFKELLMKCPQHYLMEMHEVILFYNGLGIPTRQILDSIGAIPSKTAADAKVAIQEMAEYSQKWHNGTSRSRSTENSDGLAAIQAQLNNLGIEIKKVNEKVYAAQVGCEQCKGPHYTKDCPLKEEGKTLEEAYYMQFGGPFQGGGYRAAALGFYQRNNANPSYQERRQSMEDTLSKFMSESAKRHEENSNLIKEIRASTDAAIQNQGASIKTLSSQYPKGSYGPQFSEAYSEASHIDKSIPRKEKDPGSFTLPCFINNVCFNNALVDLGASNEDIKVPLILERPFFSTARAKIDVYKRKITLKVGEERIIFTSVKPASSLIKRVYMLSLRERMELDLEARLMGKTLVLNRSLNPFFENYIELNDLNEPFKLKRNQGDDLMPTIEEGEVMEEFRTRDDELDARIDDYPIYCDYDKKIHIDWNNVIGALMNVPVFVGTFSVVTDFAVLENMYAYRDKGMGDVIFGEPFLKEVGIKTRRFEGMITIYNGNDEVTYHKDIVKEISTNIDGEFTNLEILKCWSLETSRRLFNNKFSLADASRMEEIEERVQTWLMARIQPADNTSDAGPSYDSAFISEVQSSSNTENEEQMYPTHTKIINGTIDDQIDSDIIFDSPNGNVNSGNIKKETHVPDLCALE